MEIPFKNLKIELLYDPEIPLLHLEKKNNSKRHNVHCVAHNVHCSTIYNSQDMETTYRSLNRRMDKEDVWAVKKKKKIYL